MDRLTLDKLRTKLYIVKKINEKKQHTYILLLLLL